MTIKPSTHPNKPYGKIIYLKVLEWPWVRNVSKNYIFWFNDFSENNILRNCDVNSVKLKDLIFTTKPVAEDVPRKWWKLYEI